MEHRAHGRSAGDQIELKSQNWLEASGCSDGSIVEELGVSASSLRAKKTVEMLPWTAL